MNLNLFRRSPANVKLDQATEDYLDLQAKIRQLQIDKDNQVQELLNVRRRQDMLVEEDQHKHKLARLEQDARFAREKQTWDEDKRKLLDQSKNDTDQFKKNLEADLRIKHDEVVSLCKLDAQQQIVQAKIDYERSLKELEVLAAKTNAENERKIYDRLSTELAKLHTDGNTTTSFIKDLCLEMMAKGPMPTVTAELRTVNVNSLPEAKDVK